MKRSTGYGQANDKVTEMNSLSMCVNKAIKDGYTENFKISDEKLCTPSGQCFSPGEVHVVNFYRFEGDSDPADNTILYVIEAGKNVCGTLVDAYGAYTDEHINNFMSKVKGMHKEQ